MDTPGIELSDATRELLNQLDYVITGIFVAEIGLKVAAWGWWRGEHAFLKPGATLEPSPDPQHDASLRETIT